MTVANLFAKHRAGEVSKEKFLYEVRKDDQLPYISNLTSYDDAIKILKHRGVIKETVASPYLKQYQSQYFIDSNGKKFQVSNVDQGDVYVKYTGDSQPTTYPGNFHADLESGNIHNARKADVKESKTSTKRVIREQEDLHLTIDRMNPILVNKAVNFELSKEPKVTDEIHQKITQKVVKKLQKDPHAYDDLLMSNAKEIKKIDEKKKMVPVKADNHKDPHHQMKSPKGVEKHKANTKASKTENKKGKPKGVKEMSSHAKGHKGMKQMKQPEKKHKVMESLLSLVFKKKLNEDVHHRYGVGQGVETPEGHGTVRHIVGSTITVEFDNGKMKDFQINILDHAAENKKQLPTQSPKPEVKKHEPTLDEKKDKVIKKVMEFLKKKKKKKMEEDTMIPTSSNKQSLKSKIDTNPKLNQSQKMAAKTSIDKGDTVNL